MKKNLADVQHVKGFINSYYDNSSTVTYQVSPDVTYSVKFEGQDFADLHASIIARAENKRMELTLASMPLTIAAIAALAAPKSEDNLGAVEVDFAEGLT
jgi:hypothetical protein